MTYDEALAYPIGHDLRIANADPSAVARWVYQCAQGVPQGVWIRLHKLDYGFLPDCHAALLILEHYHRLPDAALLSWPTTPSSR